MKKFLAAMALICSSSVAFAGVGDPQVKTDHPWYPGELSCSTFPRLFKTEADLYERVTGRKVDNDEDKVLAAWYWRNLNYDHATECVQDIWGAGFAKGGDSVMREYWNGLFGYGFGICYETHDQWNGEMAELLGPGRSRSCGVSGHTTFEVFLKGGAYGDGQWVLLDHDISTVVFTPDGKRMMGLLEVSKDMSSLKKADRSRGWPIGGLDSRDPAAYDQVKWVGVAAGYAGAPPITHLRSGETIRRYVNPGLDDGKTFEYWGISLPAKGIPGPMRNRTWVNQPETMFKSTQQAKYNPGQARFGNAVYTYKPDFSSDKYKEGVIDESPTQVTFEFYTPYTIAAIPATKSAGNQDPKVLYADGATGGLVLHGKMTCPVEISVDQGKTWKKTDAAKDGLDLTDVVKGETQYWIRFDADPKTLAGSGLTMETVCQCNAQLVPHLKAGNNAITFEASGHAVISAGPNKPQEETHIVDGALGTDSVTLELSTPRKEPAVAIYAACRQSSGAPPRDCSYNVDYSIDKGVTWISLVKDFKLNMAGLQPDDYFSQSFCQGHGVLDNVTGPVRVRFTNTGHRAYQLAEAHLVYKTETTSPVKVTFAWKEGDQLKTADHSYDVTAGKADTSWTLDAGANPKTEWVEYACP